MGLEQNPKSIRMFDSGLLIGDGFSRLWIWLVEGVGLRLNVVAEVKVASWQRQGGEGGVNALSIEIIIIIIIIIIGGFVVFLWNLGFFKNLSHVLRDAYSWV